MSNEQFLVRDTRLPGHFWADNEVYDVYGPDLGSHGFAVYMALCRNATNGTGECRIAMSKLGERLSISKSTVHQALARIVELGLARLLEAGGPRTSAVYLLADVKSLCDPDMAQLRLANQRSISERSQPSVLLANASVRPPNDNRTQRSISERPIRKERLTTRLNTQNTKPGFCKSCENRGMKEHKGHPGTVYYCLCEVGQQLQKKETGKTAREMQYGVGR